MALLFSRHKIASAVALVSPQGLALATAVAVVVSLLLIEMLLRLASSKRIVPLVASLGVIAILSGIVGALTGYG